ncbi:uncharacterized protein [Mytilus edulis]|uniref:uncharacterized protein n=1 Tax=Mytilus edulis TaxID=6550 RepID=UPI0039EF141D
MNISSLSASKKKLESEISAIREQINNHLDKIQDNCIAEIDKTVENSIQQIQSFLPSVTKKQKEIDDCIEDIESIKTHATDMQTFLGFKQLEINLKQTENNILSWVNGDSLSQVMVSYKLNTLLQHISKEIITFGKPVVDVNPCKLSLKRRKEGQAQLMKVNVYPKRSVEHMTLELKAKIKTEANDVSGCCILPCGKFVISNYNPSDLTICSADGKVEKIITNRVYDIHDVTCVDNETVAVISSSKKNIILVSLISGKESRIIYTSSPSHGLIYFAGNFIVCLTSGKLQRVNMQGVQDNHTNYNPSAVGSIYVSAYRNDTLYSIEKTSNKIVCHNKKGNVLWKFTDEKTLKCPQSITVDEHGISFVAMKGSNKVIAIAADGEKHKILLSEKDLRGSPWAIDYNSNLKSLLVANEKGGQAFLYTVSYK